MWNVSVKDMDRRIVSFCNSVSVTGTKSLDSGTSEVNIREFCPLPALHTMLQQSSCLPLPGAGRASYVSCLCT